LSNCQAAARLTDVTTVGTSPLLCTGMTMYLGKKGSKMFHDPLAVCVAIDPRVCEFREVTLYRR
jgi:hypothetical protein